MVHSDWLLIRNIICLSIRNLQYSILWLVCFQVLLPSCAGNNRREKKLHNTLRQMTAYKIMHGGIADVYIQSFSHYPSKQCKCKEACDTDWNFLQRSATELKGNWHMQSHKSIDHISTYNLHRNFPFLDIGFLWSTPPFGFFSTWNSAAAAVWIFINWRISCWA